MTVDEYLSAIDYPGRIIVAGFDEESSPFVLYAITGRSQNSRNRILFSSGGDIRTKAYDESLVEDPSLIIYRAFTEFDCRMVVSNGDHTETIISALSEGDSLDDALVQRTYEPDSPVFTPRIAAIADETGIAFAIIRRSGGNPERIIWKYLPERGVCHVIHTYKCNGNPVPSFDGNPIRTECGDIESIAARVWKSLSPEYRVGLFFKGASGETIINALEE